MIPLDGYRDRDVGVMGLGASGMAAARAFADAGARVFAWDDAEPRRQAFASLSETACTLDARSVGDLDLLVWSPGIPHLFPRPHPIATAARRHGVEPVADVEVLLEVAAPGPATVGITGTNGKSTTTALVGHVLSALDRRVQVGGNLGPPALGLELLPADGVYVLELSSYQLDLMPTARLGIAVLLNVSPDHLDRHGGMHGYVAAKRRVFDHARDGDVAVVAVDDDWTRAEARRLEESTRRLIRVAVDHVPAGGVGVVAGELFDGIDGEPRRVGDIGAATHLPGRHNWQNAAVAYAICRALGHDGAGIARAILGFPGLAHRLELVGEVASVRFVNDSKATNAESAARALASYDRVFWIAGGRAKEGGIEVLAPYFDRIVQAYLVGESAAAFATTLAAHGVTSRQASTLDRAVEAAWADARTDAMAGGRPVVLLSPAAASFDQWRNFEERGDAFRDRVRAIADAAGGTAP